jgi:hypothetical protein
VFVAIKWIVIGRYKPVATQFGVATICDGGLSTSARSFSVGMGIEWNHVEFYYSLLEPRFPKLGSAEADVLVT